MAVAYSDLPIVSETISGDSTSFLADLHTILSTVGWPSVPYLTGYQYTLTSSQSLSCKVRIWFDNSATYPGCFAFQFLSSATVSTGLVHHIQASDYSIGLAPFTQFAVWANRCSLFIGAVGETHNIMNAPRSVAGGVPYAFDATAPTADCAAQAAYPDVTTELWWSCGSDTGTGVTAGAFTVPTVESFRSGHYAKRYSFAFNGVIKSESTAMESDALQLGILRPPGYVRGGDPEGFTGGILFQDETPMAVDPLVIHNGTAYGQLYDSCLLSKPMALEATEEIYESADDRLSEWQNHTHGNTNVLFKIDDGRLYSLLLLQGKPVDLSVGNRAY